VQLRGTSSKSASTEFEHETAAAAILTTLIRNSKTLGLDRRIPWLGNRTLAVHISLTLRPKSVYSNLAEELLMILVDIRLIQRDFGTNHPVSLAIRTLFTSIPLT